MSGTKSSAMKTKWIKTGFPGVRYRKHPTRKHGVQHDKYFTIRYKLQGKGHEEGLGWASQGWTMDKAYDRLKELKENIKIGKGPQTLNESRKNERERKEQEQIENITFGQYFAETYYPIAVTQKKKGSYIKEDLHFRLWINPAIGDKPLKEISPFHIEKIKRKMLADKKAPRTIQYVLATVRQVWNMARRNGVVNIDSPTKPVKIPKFDNRRQRFLNHTEADLLLSTLKDRSRPLYEICLLALHSGMRASEIFHLTWGCVDTHRGIINILDAKSGKGRPVFMTKQVENMFLNMNHGKNDVFVFQKRKNEPYTEVPTLFRRVIQELKFNENVSDPRQRVCFHTLRHSFGSWHAEGGTDLYVIKELLGHGTIALTERYSHLSNGTLQTATKNFERNFDKTKKRKTENILELKH